MPIWRNESPQDDSTGQHAPTTQLIIIVSSLTHWVFWTGFPHDTLRFTIELTHVTLSQVRSRSNTFRKKIQVPSTKVYKFISIFQFVQNCSCHYTFSVNEQHFVKTSTLKIFDDFGDGCQALLLADAMPRLQQVLWEITLHFQSTSWILRHRTISMSLYLSRAGTSIPIVTDFWVSSIL